MTHDASRTLLLCTALVGLIARSIAASTPVIGGGCKLGAQDVQIGGKQTQFYLKCEANTESPTGEGIWVVKSKSAANQQAVELQQHPKKSMKKPTMPEICEPDPTAREGMPCSASDSCLQSNYAEPGSYLQCDATSQRWVKKHCQGGFLFSFEHQSCIGHSKIATFRQYIGRQTPAGGLVCSYSQCSPTNPCSIGTCNNGYCCSAAPAAFPSFAVSSLGCGSSCGMSCPGGGLPYGTCNNGLCAQGYQCTQPSNLCCAVPVLQPAYACPGGGTSGGSCVGGRCQAGYNCNSNNVCCQVVPATVCPDGTQAAGACVNGMCGTGFTCNQGLCCTNSSATPRCLDGNQAIGACIMGKCGTGYTCTVGNICCPSTLNSCPAGQTSIGTCVNGRCPAGYTCIGNQCCGAAAGGANAVTCASIDSDGPCLADNTCPQPGYSCDLVNQYCCPQVMGDPVGPCIIGEGGTRLCPSGYACSGPGTGQCYRLDTGTCAPQDQLGPCGANDSCPPGYTCIGGFCCSNNAVNNRRRRRSLESFLLAFDHGYSEHV